MFMEELILMEVLIQAVMLMLDYLNYFCVDYYYLHSDFKVVAFKNTFTPHELAIYSYLC